MPSITAAGVAESEGYVTLGLLLDLPSCQRWEGVTSVQADQGEAVTSELRPAQLMWCSDEDRKTTSRSAPTRGQKQQPWDLWPHLQVH